MTNPSEIYTWFLWKRRVNAPTSQFLHSSDLPQLGFSSLYALDESTATALQSSQDITGFKGVVWSEKLWIDCDTEETSIFVEEGLKKLGLGFERWTTGNRGAHFSINRDASPSQSLPLQDKAWVKARFPKADLGIYSHLHLFRRPGNPHEKTGQQKAVTLLHPGAAITHEAGRVRTEIDIPDSKGTAIDSSVFEDEFIMSWSTPQENGQRNKALSSIAYRFAERGESAEFTLRWMQHVNALFMEPKSLEEMTKIVQYAYRSSK